MLIIRILVLICFVFNISLHAAVSAVTIVQTSPVAFGQIIRGNLASTLTLPAVANSVPSITPTINGAIYSTAASEGIITLTGKVKHVGKTVHAIVLSNYTTLTNGSGGTITVSSMTHDNLAETKVFDAAKKMIIRVGAQITISNTQATGIYTGTYKFACLDHENNTITKTLLTISVEIKTAPVNTVIISENAAVDFGKYRRGTVNSIVNMAAVDNPIPTITPIVNGAVYASGAFSGEFILHNGTPGTAISNLVLSGYTTLVNGTNTITVNSMTHNYAGGTFNASGLMTILVGANVTIKSNQAVRVYSGTYNVSLQNSEGVTSTMTGLTMNLETITGTLPVTITQNIPLSFGEVATGTTASIVQIAPTSNDATIISGDAHAFSINGTPASSRAEVLVTGEPNTVVSITFSTGDLLTGPGTSMSLNTFTRDGAANPVSLGTLGNLTFKVGARLNIGANQAQGTYSGTYSVTVNYA